MNRVVLCGRLGQDPELKHTPNGASVCQFSLATTKVWIDQGQKHERTEWHRVVVWGKTADNCAKYLGKGRRVLLEGEIQYRKYTDKQNVEKYVTEIKADNVEFLEGGSDNPNQNQSHNRNPDKPDGYSNRQNQPAPGTSLDDIPF